MSDQRYSEDDVSRRDIPSFIEPRPPLVDHPFKRPRPQKGMNLLELFEEDSEIEEPELVQVYLRLKPSKLPNTLYDVRSDTCLVTSLDTATAGHGRRTQHNVSKMYNFTKIFEPHCDQKQIFEQVVKNNLKKLPEGHNFTLLTYGASGSGKTYTVMGTVGSPGLVPRSLEYVFKLVDAAQQPLYKPAENGAVKLNIQTQNNELQWVKRLGQVTAPHQDKYRRMSVRLHNDLTVSSTDLSNRVQYYVWVSFIEIYNEAVYDLLAPPDKRTKLRIREDSSGNVFVKGATQVFVRSGEEAYNVMAAGKHNLVVAATGVHAQSSRSHCIFTISMLTETAGSVRTSCVRLCDLAGCERARATRNTGARMQESRAINSSLHVLERCLHMLRKNQRSKNDVLVPYRESKLTRLLGSGLSGAKGEAVSMVVTLNMSPEYAHETKHVLGLASVAQDIQITNTMLESRFESSSTTYAQETTVNDYSTDMLMLRAENERLQFELYQAQARCKELLATIAEMQRAKASEMYEVMEEAKDLTQQYYETEIKILKSQMQDMSEEFESRISELEDKLTVERLARDRAEEKLHYNTCINCKKDESFKAIKPPENIMVLSDSDHDSEEESDPLNESLEPTFKNINHNDSFNLRTMDNIEEENNLSDNENSSISSNGSDSLNNPHQSEQTDRELKNQSADKIVTVVDDVHEEINSENDESKEIIYNTIDNDDESEIESRNATLDSEDERNIDKTGPSVRNSVEKETSFYSIDDQNNEQNKKSTEQNMSSCRGTYFVRVSATDIQNNHNDFGSNTVNKQNDDSKENSVNFHRSTYFISSSTSDMSKNTDNKDTKAKEILKDPVMIEPCRKIYASNSTLINEIRQESEKKNCNLFRGTYFVSNDSSCHAKESNDREEIKENFQKSVVTDTSENNKISKNLIHHPVNNDKSVNNVSIDVISINAENKSKGETKGVFKEPFVIEPNTKVSAIDNKLNDDNGKLTVNIVCSINDTLGKDRALQVSKNIDNTDRYTTKAVYKPLVDIKLNTEGSHSHPTQTECNIFNTAKVTMKLPTAVQSSSKVTENFATKLIKSSKSSQDSDSSLRQFEQLEKAMKDLDNEEAINCSMPKKQSAFQTMNVLKGQESHFNIEAHKTVKNTEHDTHPNKEKRVYFDNIDVGIDESSNKNTEFKVIDEKRTVSLIKDHIKSIKITDIDSNKIDKKIEASTNISTEKRVYFDNIDVGLGESNNKNNEIKDIEEKHSHSIVKDNVESSKTASVEPKEIDKKFKAVKKQVYFDMIDVDLNGPINTNDKIESIDEQNSNSAAKENIELSKITNLLRESFTKPEIITSVKKTRLAKQQESVDLFESPIVVKAKDNIDIEIATDSIERLALKQQPDKNFTCGLQLTPSFKNDFKYATVKDENCEITCNTKLPIKEVYDIPVKKETTSSLIDQNEDNKCITKLETTILLDKNLIKNMSINKDIELAITEPKKDIKMEQISSIETVKHEIKLELASSTEEPNHDAHESHSAVNDNTVEEFEKIYKDISANRTTEFDLLVSQSINDTSAKIDKEEIKYNLRKKPNNSKVVDDVVLASGVVETKNRTRSLRLRRQKKQEEDEVDDKLKDIGNLQTEFSDVTMDIPAAQKVVEDIQSPEKGVEENVHPIYGIQSCPSKSITRSRRKLFTPRAEPLEESLNQTENSNERVCVPRPSYHRPRARRKL